MIAARQGEGKRNIRMAAQPQQVRKHYESHHTPQGNTPGMFLAVIHNRSFKKPWSRRHTKRWRCTRRYR